MRPVDSPWPPCDFPSGASDDGSPLGKVDGFSLNMLH